MATKVESTEVKFDAIKAMREIRDKMSLAIQDMTCEEENVYLDKLIAAKKSEKGK